MSVPLRFVRHPRARRYVIRVNANGEVRVTFPRWGSKREAALFAQQNEGWIARQRDIARERLKDSPSLLTEDEATLLRKRATKELPAALMAFAVKHGLVVAGVSIRNQRWRWGSCSPSGRISLNWRLILLPDAVREYVLIHELMHLRRLDHSKAFWKLVAEACPSYEVSRAWLRKNGQLLNQPIRG